MVHKREWPALADNTGDLPPIYEQLLRDIFNGRIAPGTIDKDTARDTAETLLHGVHKGYGDALPAIDYDTPNYNMLANLEKNVYQFAAAKNYQQLAELTRMLTKDGKVVTFREFKQQAATVLNEYNVKYLQAEYSTAVNGAINAGKWVDFEANAQYMPNLKYRTVGDQRVREDHRLLDGVIRPIDDDFWKTYYPPNGWNCRCTVLQVSGNDPVTARSEIQYPDVPKMWQTNLAKEGLVFPPASPYYKDMPREVLKQTIGIQQPVIRAWAKDNLVGKTVQHPELGEIGFNNKAIKEALNQPHRDMFMKNQAIYRIEQILQGKVVRTANDAKGRALKWHYIKTRVSGRQSYAVVKEDLWTGLKIFYTIVDALK